MNPYWGQDFWGFFSVLARRLTGNLPLDKLPSDEIQLLVLLGVAFSTVLLGTLLTLKKMTMMANSLSHTTLLGIVITFLLMTTGSDLHLNSGPLLLAAFISALLTAVLTEMTRDLFKLQEDAAIGLIFTTLFALGIILVTVFTRNAHIGVEVITGNIDALHPKDIVFVWTTACINFFFIVIFFRQWIITAFDEKLAFSLGIPTRLFHYLLMFLTALSLIAAFRAVGVILVLSFLVGPPLMARRFTHKLVPLLFIAIICAFFLSVIGVALSRHFLSVHHTPLSTGGLVVTLISLSYLFSVLLTFRTSQGLIRVR